MTEKIRSLRKCFVSMLVVAVLFGGINFASGADSSNSSRSGGRARVFAATEKITAKELLDKYAATQDKIYKSFVMKFEASSDGYKSWSGILEGGKRKGGVDSEIRFDGKRFYWSRRMWANCYPDVMTFVPRNDPRAKWDLWDGSTHYHGGNEPYKRITKLADKRFKTGQDREDFMRQRLRVTIRNKFDRYCHFPKSKDTTREGDRIKLDRCDFYFTDMCGGGGYFYDPQLLSELGKADKLSLFAKTEEVNSSNCYVIKAEDKDCNYKLWVDEKHGYNLARFQKIQRRTNPDTTVATIRNEIRNVKFKEIDGICVPIEWDFEYYTKSSEGHIIRSTTHIKRTKVMIDPNHDNLNSFVPDIPDGWAVRFKDIEVINEEKKFTWQNGAIVDEDGQVINLKKIGKETINVGK